MNPSLLLKPKGKSLNDINPLNCFAETRLKSTDNSESLIRVKIVLTDVVEADSDCECVAVHIIAVFEFNINVDILKS